jgi:TP901 family phage tail tape measure protein
MATISNYVRWASNTEELKRNLKDGLNQIEATRAGAEKMVQALGGDKLIAAAHKYAAAVQEMGGAAALTRAEQDRVNVVVTKALEKYQALGKEAPTALRELAAATKNVEQESARSWKAIEGQLSSFSGLSKTVGLGLTAAFTAPLVGLGFAASKASMDFETAFAGVRKTVSGTPAELQHINDAFREMAKTTPASAVELAKIGEMAGQLGVKKESITAFTKTIVDISTATNLTADEAGSAFARLANVLKMPQDQFSNLGSAVVALGNFGASTEQEMLSMAQRISAAGATANMTAPQILGIANALSSVGIEAEAGGTAVSRVINKIGTDVHTGGGHLQTFAKIAGLSAQEFQKAWRDDAGMAFSKFMQGLANARERGGDELLGLMEELGFKEVRLRNAFMAAANAGTLMADSIALGTKAFNENTEVTRAAEERYKTAANQLKVLYNNLTDVAITLGDALVPMLTSAIGALKPVIEGVSELAKGFKDLPALAQYTIVGFAGLLAAMGPLILAAGSVAFGLTQIIALGTAFPALGAAATGAFTAMTTGMTGMVLVAGGVVALAIAVGTLTYALTRLADIATGGKLSAWLTPFLSGTQELALQTQEAGAGADAMRLATERSGHAVHTMAEALQINTEWLKQHNANARLAATAQTAFVGPMRESAAAAQSLAEKVKALTEAQKADIAAKVAQGYGIKAIAAETQIASEVVSAYLKQQHLATAGSKAHAKALDEERFAHIPLTAAQQARVESLLKLKLTEEQVAQAAGVHVVQVKQLVAAQKEAADVEKFLLKVRLDAEKASGKLDEAAATRLHKQTDQIAHSMIEGLKLETAARLEARDLRLKASVDEFTYQQIKLGEWVAREKAKLAETVGDHTAAYADIEAIAQEKFRALARAHQEALEEMKAQEFTWARGLQGVLGGIPGLLTQAFTGGGGMGGAGKAIASSVGAFAGTGLTGIATGLFNKAAPALLNTLGMGMTKMIGAAVPMIGPLIGAFAPQIIGGFKKLFGGVSEEEKKGRETIKAFEAQIASTLSATQKAEAGGDSWKMTVIGVRDAYLKAGKSAADTEAAVQKLWNSSKLGAAATKAAIEEINAVLEDQKQDEKDLEAAIQRYGFSIEQLGPAMQKQRLDEQAKQLLNDWRLLIGAGIAVGDVNSKMSGSMRDYLALAKRTGQEVPAAMKPILQSMIDQGILLDENGNAFTDLGQLGISFAETMTAGFDRVVAKLDDLLRGLGLLPPALDDVTNHLPSGSEPGGTEDTEPRGPGSGRPEYAATGGFVRALGVQHFDVGGWVKASGWREPWTFAKRGSDTVPAMLTPGELILNQGQQAQIVSLLDKGAQAAQGVLAGGKQTPIIMQEQLTVHLTVQSLDPRGVPEIVEQQMMPEITKQLEDRRRGYTSRWQQALATT